MSADLLRRAAALMRERAEAATPGRWGVGNDLHIATEVEQTSRASFRFGWMIAEVQHEDYRDYGGTSYDDEPRCGQGAADASHIAAWHPAVALAVADWLESVAAEHESDAGSPESVIRFFAGFVTPADHAALAVARAYLGQAS